VIERYDDLSTLTTEWDALADQVGAPPFVRPGWIDTFGDGRTVALGVRPTVASWLSRR